MKQSPTVSLSIAFILILAVCAAVFFLLYGLLKSENVASNSESSQISVAARLATLDPAFLTRPPTPEPPPLSSLDLGHGVTEPSEGESVAEPLPETIDHTVQAGDNLFRIALEYGVTVESVMAANGLNADSLIYAGQVLAIPKPQGTDGEAVVEFAATPEPPAVSSAPPTETPFPPTQRPKPVIVTTINGVDRASFIIMPEAVKRNASAIFAAGQAIGRDPHAYSKVGDSTIENPHFMTRFDEGAYNLGDYAFLQGAINHFAGSHGRQGQAVKRGLHSWTATDPTWADKTLCEPNESPVVCEIRLQNPSILLIRLGSNDRGVPAGFEQNLRQVVQIAIDSGVLPVLGTKADRFEDSNINNEIIRRVAAEFQVPLWDFDVLASTIPGRGLDVDAVHLTTFYAHDYTSPTAYQRGHGVHNLSALMVLDLIWREIMQGAAG